MFPHRPLSLPNKEEFHYNNRCFGRSMGSLLGVWPSTSSYLINGQRTSAFQRLLLGA
ncbi:hypothetical protein Q31a_22140 [Aureliella helgolandensis]|uniref:Uncharacterized protein n=1 Tax=Aureliella helgolandensis TaxID=2527968 RepID=A0A518G5R0_9BACT|nr:hypothetical protein Q31a_22140 [Aureliella helgolandensis]